MVDTAIHQAAQLRRCWNCKDPARPIFFKILCLDCWRIGLIVLLLGGGGGDGLHHVLEKFGFLRGW